VVNFVDAKAPDFSKLQQDSASSRKQFNQNQIKKRQKSARFNRVLNLVRDQEAGGSFRRAQGRQIHSPRPFFPIHVFAFRCFCGFREASRPSNPAKFLRFPSLGPNPLEGHPRLCPCFADRRIQRVNAYSIKLLQSPDLPPLARFILAWFSDAATYGGTLPRQHQRVRQSLN